MNFESRRPSGPLFRVGRDDDAWVIPDWAYAKEDGTFGNRFDDPMGDDVDFQNYHVFRGNAHVLSGYSAAPEEPSTPLPSGVNPPHPKR